MVRRVRTLSLLATLALVAAAPAGLRADSRVDPARLPAAGAPSRPLQRDRARARSAETPPARSFVDLDRAALATVSGGANKAVARSQALLDPLGERRDGTSTATAGPVAVAGAGDPWSADRLLANPTDMNDEYVSLERSPLSGDLYAVFAATDLGGSDRDVHIARSRDDGLTWTTWELPSYSEDEYHPELAIDAGGFLHVVWIRDDGVIMRARSEHADDPAAWAFANGLVVGEPCATPSIAVSGAGDFATVFIAAGWYTVNWDTYSYEWTLIWMYSTNGGQTVVYDYFLPDGYVDYWPDVSMESGYVHFVNAEQDYWTGQLEILVANDTYDGAFTDVAAFTGWTENNCGYPRVVGEGDDVYVVYQHDWSDGVTTDGDIIYTYSRDAGGSWFGPFGMAADEYESVGPAIFVDQGVVGCLWLDAPAGGDEFDLAARIGGGGGTSDQFGDVEIVTDAPLVDPTFHSAGGVRSASGIHAAWIDRRDFPTQGHNVYTATRSLAADLAPFTPTGWDSSLVATSVRGQRHQTWLTAEDSTFVSFACQNAGLADAQEIFQMHLELDGAPVASWTVSGLATSAWVTVEDHPLMVGPGDHTFTVRLDPTGVVAEEDETDNVFDQTFTWYSGDPRLRFSPYPLVVVMAPAKSALDLAALAAAPPVQRSQHLSPLGARLASSLDKAGGGDLLPVIIHPTARLDAPALAKALAEVDPAGRRRTVLAAAETQIERSRTVLAPDLERLRRSGDAGEARNLALAGALAVDLSAAAVRDLAANPEVGFMWLDDRPCASFGGPTAGAAPAKATAWHLDRVGAPAAWAADRTGAGVLVGHLDSGVAYDHPDLAGGMWQGGSQWPNHGWDFVDDDNDPYDGDTSFYHGTHTAGLVVGDGSAGTTTGVAPGAELMALRVVPGYFEDLTDALQFGLDRGVDLFTFSGGWLSPSDGLRAANRHQAQVLLAAGLPWLCSAGNGDNQGGHFAVPNDLASPGDCPNPWYVPNGGGTAVISVGASTFADGVWDGSSVGPTVWDVDNPYGESNYRDYPWPPGLMKPDIAAPGDLVTSCTAGGGYVVFSGTSMSCPMVAGAVAILLEDNPGATPAQLARVLEESARDITVSPAAPGRDNHTGAGLIDLEAALGELPAAATATFWLHNDGGLPLTVRDLDEQADWLSLAFTTSTIAPGDSLAVDLVITPEVLPAGQHQAVLVARSNDPASPGYMPVILDWGGDLSGVDDTVPPLPAAGLDNYPNPFNPRTVLRFTVRGPGRHVLDIHDVRGRRVRRLVDGPLPTGDRSVAWDGADDAGRPLASGQYLARLVADGRDPVTRKLVLVR